MWVWLVIEHVPYDGSGGVAAALGRAGKRAVHMRPYAGEALPQAADLTGLVVLDGPSGAADDEVPHLAAERHLLRQTVDLGLPVLGVCFGAQSLAVALAGSVTRATSPEVGMNAVQLTAAGHADPVLSPAGAEPSVLQWHHDTYTLPPRAVSLATSDACAAQAFSYGRNVYDLQFHIELDSALAELVRPQLPGVVLSEAAVERASRCAAAVSTASSPCPDVPSWGPLRGRRGSAAPAGSRPMGGRAGGDAPRRSRCRAPWAASKDR